MIVRCPQCQYANKVEVEAGKPRIVCARCATVISVEFLSSYTPVPTSLSSEGKGQTDQSNMQITETSPLDIDSLLDSSEPEVAVPTPPPPPSMAQVLVTPIASTVIPVSESRWEGDEILDIPRSAQGTVPPPTPVSENSPDIVDVLTPIQPAATEPILPLQADLVEMEPYDSTSAASASDELLDEINPYPPPEVLPPPVNVEQAVEPVVEEKGQPKSDPVFAQDSYDFRKNTFVMVTPDKRKGRLVKMFLAIGLLCALLAFGWWTLSPLIKSWINKPEVVTTTTVTPAEQNPNASNPVATPTAVPSLGSKVGSESPNPGEASPAASAKSSVSPSATVASKPSVTPTATPAAPQKATPTPAAQAGNSGHSVAAGEGSLTVQIAAYKSQSEAQQTANRLKSSGIEARIVKAEVTGKGTWYRVQTGRFTSEAEASKYASELRAKGTAKNFIITGYQAQ